MKLLKKSDSYKSRHEADDTTRTPRLSLVGRHDNEPLPGDLRHDQEPPEPWRLLLGARPLQFQR